MKIGYKNKPIVQGNGHIIGTKAGKIKECAKCALYEDNEGNLYCTAELIPLERWLISYGCDGYNTN